MSTRQNIMLKDLKLMKRPIIPETLESRRMGLTTPSLFRSSVLRAKLGHIDNHREIVSKSRVRIHRLDPEDRSTTPLECDFITPFKDSFIGAWTKGKNVHQSLYVSHIPSSDLQSHIPTEDMEICGLFRNCVIKDVCGMDIGTLDFPYILFVAQSLDKAHSYAKIVPRKLRGSNITFPLDSIGFQFNNSVHCCAWNALSRDFVLGTDLGMIITRFEEVPFLEKGFVSPGSSCERYIMPYVLDFNSNGNLLYIGFNDGFVACSDQRWDHGTLINPRFVGKGISRVKLLEDDVTLIASGHDSKLCLVDTRMNAVVFDYYGHFNMQKNIPFHVDESLDVISACGEDYVTRVWRLRQGERLAELAPTFMDDPGSYVYAATVAKGRNLYSHIFTGNEAYCFKL